MIDIKEIKGIGPKSLSYLNKLNINTTEDLVTYYPYRYEVLKKTSLDEEKSVVSARVESAPTLNYFKKLNRLNFRAQIDNKVINVVIFNRGYLKNEIKVGSTITLIGKYEKEKNLFTCNNLKLYDIGDRVEISPVYHLVSGLTNKSLNKFIVNALDGIALKDYIPVEYSNKYGFIPKVEAIKNLHMPVNLKKVKESIIRCKYEELFLFMLKINYLKRKNSDYIKGYSKNIDKEKIDEFISKLPYKLTSDQEKVLLEIEEDLASEKRMNRLVEGDVGSGKTIVSMIAMFIMKLNNYQSSLMAPTEILAKQHYENAVKLFKDYDINIGLLIGSLTKKEKEKIKKEIKEGKIDIVIGTHTLVQDDVEFNNLGLVITDEQHRFGVNQRNNLRNKGNLPDVLYMSATPIPRTFALTIYGDMDVSIIKEMPKGRIPVKTKVFNNKEMNSVYKLMEEELKNNHQIYVIAPLIEESDNETDLATVYTLRDKMNLIFGSKYKIDIVHGKMKSQEKELIMEEFKQNIVNILISTTVIEVGVDVKNATMIVIFDANRFGLSTLHQLRGRVGRSNLESKCLLISDKEDVKRLEIMEKVNDGFEISEEDFKLRGSGDLFGTKQSGDMTFKMANLRNDYKILLQAKKDSEEYLKNKEYDNEELKKRLINSIKSD